MLNPIVINSKKADQYLNKVRDEHRSILEGMNTHAQRVIFEREKESVKQAQADKEQLESDRKMKELEIKAAALSL